MSLGVSDLIVVETPDAGWVETRFESRARLKRFNAERISPAVW